SLKFALSNENISILLCSALQIFQAWLSNNFLANKIHFSCPDSIRGRKSGIKTRAEIKVWTGYAG
ncbi:MAG: hypothetical protein ACPGYG_05125, partial [Candidatus Puniceispirillaceae bacterium]